MQVDVFSYGMLLWELVTKEQPQRGHMRDVRVPEECAPSPEPRALSSMKPCVGFTPRGYFDPRRKNRKRQTHAGRMREEGAQLRHGGIVLIPALQYAQYQPAKNSLCPTAQDAPD